MLKLLDLTNDLESNNLPLLPLSLPPAPTRLILLPASVRLLPRVPFLAATSAFFCFNSACLSF